MFRKSSANINNANIKLEIQHIRNFYSYRGNNIIRCFILDTLEILSSVGESDFLIFFLSLVSN